jgi:hypothetical protein
MQQPFGHILEFRLLRAQSWFSLGPGWAAAAGVLATTYPDLTLAALAQFIGLWLLVDPILGTLWELAVGQRLWRQAARPHLPPPPLRGFFLPYAQPGSAGGRFVLFIRRYRLWWRDDCWPAYGGQIVTFITAAVLALTIGALLQPTIFWLTVLAVSLTLLAGFNAPELVAPSGGRLQSITQLLLPWLMGSSLGVSPGISAVALGVCYWVAYLGGLRMLGRHRRAEILFFSGQTAALLLLLGLRLLPGAAMLSVLFLAQLLLKTNFPQPDDFLKKAQPYLILSMLAAGLSLGGLAS